MTGIFIEGSTINIGVTGSGGSGWSPIGAAYDADFTRNRYADNGMAATFSDLNTLVRASAGTAFDLAGNLQSFASGAPRITDRGLLIEEARTNSIRNNTMVGALPGAIGAVANPTNWSGNLLSTGGTSGTQSMSTVNGLEFIFANISGATPAANTVVWPFEAPNSIAATPGQVWAVSTFTQLLSGSLSSGFSSFDIVLREHDSGGAFLRQTPVSIQASDATVKRFATTVTLGANTVFISAGIRATYTGSAAAFNLGIGLPQLEQGASATSPIKTTNAAATRAADVITAPSRFASFSQCSFYAEVDDLIGANAGILRAIFGIRVDANDRVDLRVNDRFFNQTTAGGVTAANLTSINTANTGINKVAGRWAINDFAARFSPYLGDPTNDVSGAVPTGAPILGIGQNGVSGNFYNGYLRRLTFFPRKRTDAELSALVAA